MAQAKLLQIGDVVRLSFGMQVYAKFPECFIYGNRQDSPLDKIAETNIKIGECRSDGKSKLLISPGVFEGVYFDTGTYVGEYVVIETNFCGGGTGHGLHDGFPNGHKVTVKGLKEDGSYYPEGVELSFYQSGCFSAMIRPEEIEPIRRMERSFA